MMQRACLLGRPAGTYTWLVMAGLLVALGSCGDDEEPGQVASADCQSCHTAEAAAWQNFSSHKDIYKSCTFCHEEAQAEPGKGHRTSPWCDACHSELGHPPESFIPTAWDDGLLFITCTTCHNPMGSKNLYLVRERILVEPGRQVSIAFENTEGRADSSYAELGSEDGGENGKEPGSGLCEVCHTRTSAYNRSGTGRSHYRSRCAACHDHALAFGPKPDCAGCHTVAVDRIYDSLHTTRKGMATWYAAEAGGFETFTGIAYEELACKDCHRADQPDWKGPGCRDCHETGRTDVDSQACLKCHGRQAAEIEKQELSDVHRDAGMGCTDCHPFTDIHDSGGPYDSMLEPGAIEANCRNCHRLILPNPYHAIHSDTVDCSTCHIQTVVTCYNCHFDSEVSGKGKVVYGQFKGWRFLLNRSGKVYPGNIQALKFGHLEDGTGATFVAIAPYFSHSIARKAVGCGDCHGSAAVEEYVSTGAIQVVHWNPETETLEHATGIIPIPPDYATALEFAFVDWDGTSHDGQGRPVWTFFKSTTDAMQMIEEYGSPLTEEQIEKLR